MIMRQLFLPFLMAASLLLSFSPAAKAQDTPDEEGVIVIDLSSITTEHGPKRSPVLVPINATYYVPSSCLEILFLFDMGDVSVSVTNISSGDHYSTTVESYCGTAILPLPLSSGLWAISFSTDDGDNYIGYFIIS